MDDEYLIAQKFHINEREAVAPLHRVWLSFGVPSVGWSQVLHYPCHRPLCGLYELSVLAITMSSAYEYNLTSEMERVFRRFVQLRWLQLLSG